MKHIFPLILTLIMTLLTSHAAFASELTNSVPSNNDGKALLDQSCQRCHDNAVYTRPNSIIFSLTALEKRVRFCESMAAAHWTEPQMKTVIDYLNQRFYHFKH